MKRITVKPIRIQRKRSKGWKMPPNTIYVGRPTVWGNQFRVGADGDAKTCVALFRNNIENNIWSRPNKAGIRQDLRGKNLACWCKVGDPCHADVLLEIANS